mmetsp:Transcript_54828/g.79992  ORF Transcript_54828/g.79992 Transcript_54828/m.79992 type:complete len:88 (-) Transcript_54828:167-430(-)
MLYADDFKHHPTNKKTPNLMCQIMAANLLLMKKKQQPWRKRQFLVIASFYQYYSVQLLSQVPKTACCAKLAVTSVFKTEADNPWLDC